MEKIYVPDLQNISISDQSVEAFMPHLALLINRSGQKISQLVDSSLEEFEIKAWHFSILLLVKLVEESLSQKEIGERLLIDRNTMVKLIDHLEARALMKRVPNPKDRRSYCLEITTKGEQLLERANAKVSAAKSESLRVLTTAETKQLTLLLMKFLQT